MTLAKLVQNLIVWLTQASFPKTRFPGKTRLDKPEGCGRNRVSLVTQITKQVLETKDRPQTTYVGCTLTAEVTRINDHLKRGRDRNIVAHRKAIERL